MKRVLCAIAVILVVLSFPTPLSFFAEAQSGPILSAWSTNTPLIDGLFFPLEWDDAYSVSFGLVDQAGESHLAFLWVKNDADYLYLAVRVLIDDFNPCDGVFFRFDNDNDGSYEAGDDWLYVVAWSDGRGYAVDGFLKSAPPTATWTSDTNEGGTNDILGAAHHSNIGGIGDYSFELRHPLDSDDDSHDFSLGPNDKVGVIMEFDDAFLGGAHYGLWPSFGGFAAILVAPLPAIPDFSISASPTTLIIPVGQTATATITFSSTNSFTGTVYTGIGGVYSEDHTFLPDYMEWVSAATVTIPSGGATSWTLFIKIFPAAAPGTYYTHVGGFFPDPMNPQISHVFYLTVIVVDRPIELGNPVEGYLTSPFGSRSFDGKQEFHDGIDIAGLIPGEILGHEIFAPANGEVVSVGFHVDWGYYMRIWHGSVKRLDGSIAAGVSTSYCHLLELPRRSTGELLQPGDTVGQGEVIGKVGATGKKVTGPHLHFMVREGDKVVDPLPECGHGGYVIYEPRPGLGLRIETCSPVDIVVTDPNGYLVSKNLIQIDETASYLEADFNGDGDSEDRICITEREIGDYLIAIVAEPSASPTDTYTLEVSSDGTTHVLAVNVEIINSPAQPYIVRSTETETVPIIPATVDFDPNMLNVKSKGLWVTAYIELPVGHGYSIRDIDVASVMLNSQVQAEARPTEIGDYDIDGIPDLMVKFDREAVQTIFQGGDEVQVTITGELVGSRLFEGEGAIRVISQEK